MRRIRLGCLSSILLTLAIAGGAVLAADAVFAPWSFHLGGSTHLIPIWQGAARIRASSGEYRLFLWMQPTSSNGSILHLPSVTGSADLCTPRGERFRLTLSGGFHERVGTDTNGKQMGLSLHRRPPWADFTNADRRPRLQFSGEWRNAELVLSDGGSLSRAFLPDGTAYYGPPRDQPTARETLTFAVHEVGWSAWLSDCRTYEGESAK